MSALLVVAACSSMETTSFDTPLDGPRLGPDRMSHEDIASGAVDFETIRREGMKIFSMPFVIEDGYGDGPMNAEDPISPGGRPTLQGNGTFLRVNGLDAQSCLECHSILSAATVPSTFAVGGTGGAATNAMFQPRSIDTTDSAAAGMAGFDGRFINPPFLFGSGGVELLAAEMTAELQALRERAMYRPGEVMPLITKGVDFGTIVFRDGEFDTSDVSGIDGDLVVRPFGRKGVFPTVRAFDVEAMPFHFGMQPNETVGEGVDLDGDGVANELTIGEISAMSIFNTTLMPPVVEPLDGYEAGFGVFERIGCGTCHIPSLIADGTHVQYRYPEIDGDPSANVFYEADLRDAGFDEAEGGGLVVPLFADLKRHDMGLGLSESFGSELDQMFSTARLWGVADTAPYMHDGRATTLAEAILMHGGEAKGKADAFKHLSDEDRAALLAFLGSLRTPEEPTNGMAGG